MKIIHTITCCSCIALISIIFSGPPVAQADELIMTTGEHFTSSKIWEEGDKIRFNMQGIIVSVNKDEVARIIKSGGDTPQHIDQNQGIYGPLPGNENKDNHALTMRTANSGAIAPDETPPPKSLLGNWQGAAPQRPASKRNTSHPKMSNKGIGIEGITWRMPLKQMTGLEKAETDPAFGGIDQYYRPDQPMHFAGADLDGLVYGFWRDQLYSIMMWTEGRISYTHLKRGLFAFYGRGTQRRPEVERYIWDEQNTQRMLEFDEQSKTGIFIMRSSELDEIIKQRYPASSNQ